ncbi:hypothetical protein G6M89_14730 [Natronolimnobius sp. AArcel1]|uniref:HalOD1 output domain-containing protein n=1 Tax=Natronolimnobius sp. AArcel1 TaxID=1679093 RepID=UPI0013EC883A|nr:hypothetical protein [Natronolimnobius sp. AArcel1]
MREELTSDIIEAIAIYNDVCSSELGFTLYDHVDPDAINSLSKRSNSVWTVSFRVPTNNVTIDSRGNILVDGDQVLNWKENNSICLDTG